MRSMFDLATFFAFFTARFCFNDFPDFFDVV
jgi:hypothetical protein